MPSVDFYYMPESPPCRAVEMVAGILGVTLNKHYINLFTKEQHSEEYAKVSALRKVPVIVDGSFKMGESRAILMYLVNKYGKGHESLYPEDPEKRASVDEMLFYDAGTLFAAQSKFLRPRLFGPVKEDNADDEKAYRDCLRYLNTRLAEGKSKFMLGDDLTIADISLSATLSFATSCEYDLSEFEDVTAYQEKLKKAIPKYGEINDDAVATITKFIKDRQEAS